MRIKYARNLSFFMWLLYVQLLGDRQGRRSRGRAWGAVKELRTQWKLMNNKKLFPSMFFILFNNNVDLSVFPVRKLYTEQMFVLVSMDMLRLS